MHVAGQFEKVTRHRPMIVFRTTRLIFLIIGIFTLNHISILWKFDYGGVQNEIIPRRSLAGFSNKSTTMITDPPNTKVIVAHNSSAYDMSMEVYARAFDPWPRNRALPCPPQDVKINPGNPFALRVPADEGLLYIKLMKTGGSTAAGINVRVARKLARRLKKKKNRCCRARWDHAPAHVIAGTRNRTASFLWTVVREPTARAVSQFFHFRVSRENSTTDDETFQRYLKRREFFAHYPRALSVKRARIYPNPYRRTDNIANVVRQIMENYDFIGVTERMDESAVVLMMLLGLKMGDIMYLSAKGNGGYDDGQYKETCHYIKPSFVSPGMEAYFQSEEWGSFVKWDRILYEAANLSLDMTIDRLGRKEFESNLSGFQAAQELAKNRCLPLEVFPCTSTGEWNKNQSCLWSDSGCGFKCLDEVARELQIS